MEDSKKGMVFVAIIWGILFIYMNFIVVEQLPYWWIEYRGLTHRTTGNILVAIVVISMIVLVLLPKSKAQKRKERI
jgi:hypothetical protein